MRVLCLLAFLLFAFSAHAQTDVIVNWRAPGGTTPVTNANPLPISGSFSATLGGFAPSLSYATCTATASSCSSTALPTNSGSVVLFNTGTTTVSCTLASGAATALASELQIPASSGLALATVYSATTYDHFACIDQAGSASNVVVASGGSGLPTGWGGGGGGASGTITNWGSGSNTLGAMANYGTSPGAVLVPGVNAFVTNTNANGQATMSNSSPVTIASDQSAIPVTPAAGTTGGTIQYHLIAANTTNSTNVKASAGVVYSIQTGNIGASAPAYLKFYDKATAPTCNTDTVVKTILIPANSLGGGNNVSIPVGAGFTSGIGICVTGGIADNDNTAVAASTVIINLGYK